MTLFTVIGNPVAHSLSPHIHLLFAQQFAIDLRYTRSLSSPARFTRTVSEFFRRGGVGANVTVPFKQAAYALCSSVSARAQAAAAVNTLRLGEHGQLYGDNTDGFGLVTDLQRQLGDVSDFRVVVIGAGGATRGVLLPLLQAGVSAITVANRTVLRAEQLLQQVTPYLSADQRQAVKVLALDELTNQHCKQAIVVNATSGGWSGQQLALDSRCLAEVALAYDMNYGATTTPFLQQAEKAGAIARCDGLGMLVEQAAASFAVWHDGRMPDTEPVLKQLRSIMAH